MAWGISAILATLLLFTNSSAKLQCKPYVPHGQIGNKGVINFTGVGNLSYVASFNATPGNPVKVSSASLAGTTFHFEQCTGDTVGSSDCLLYCSDEECAINYDRSIRVINPTTGHCLSHRNVTNTTNIEMYFAKCSTKEAHNHGLWTTIQTVFYKVAYDNGENPHPTNQYLYSDNATFFPYGTQTPCNFYDYCRNRPWFLKNDSATIIAGQQMLPTSLDAVVLTTNWTVVNQNYFCFPNMKKRSHELLL